MSEPIHYFQPNIFSGFPEVASVHSLRDSDLEDGFSILPSNTTLEVAASHRDELAAALGFSTNHLAAPKEVHGDTIITLDDSYRFDDRPEGDAIITDLPGWLVGATVADCVAVLLYDPEHKAIAAIHSGWRGSSLNIVGKAITAMRDTYHTDPTELFAYISPAPKLREYGLNIEAANKFDSKYREPKSDNDAYLDNQSVVKDQVLSAGVLPEHMEIDPRSTINDPQLHSYRRDRDQAGRMYVGIGLKA